MRLYAILAVCVCAHAATVPQPQRRIDDLDDVELDNVVSEPELVEQTNGVKDIDNNLRNVIPVKVIEDNKKIDENSNDYVPETDSIDIKRAPIDLKNPGSPQRQEHETQNPEHYSDAQKAIFTIKQTIEDTQEVFTKGLKSISENFNQLFANNEQLSTIQQNIQSLKNSFNEQVLKLNSTIKSYINPEKIEEVDEDVKVVETKLRVLESNFKSGVHTLSEGVELLAIMKEEDEAAKAEADAAAPPAGNQNAQATTSTQAPISQNNNPVMQFLYNFQQGMISSINGLNSAVQNYFNQGQNQNQNQGQTQQTTTTQGGNFVSNLFQGIQLPFGQNQQGQSQQPAQSPTQGEQKPPGAVADTPAQTGWRPPNIIQQVQNSWNNLINGGQGTQQAQQPSQNPLQQAFQNIVNVFQRPGNNQQSSTQASNSAATTSQPAADVPQGVNVVPVTPVQNQAQAQTVQPQQQQTAPSRSGPIQQIVQNNPIIKGLQTVATRITNPDRPRDTADKSTDDKGVLIVPVKQHGGSGDSSIGSRLEQNVQKMKEDKKDDCEKETKKEESISPEPVKTE